MTNIPTFKPRKVVKILKKHGFEEIGQSGSHLHLFNSNKNLRATVPMHNKDLKKKTAQSIFRQAGIKIEDVI